MTTDTDFFRSSSVMRFPSFITTSKSGRLSPTIRSAPFRSSFIHPDNTVRTANIDMILFIFIVLGPSRIWISGTVATLGPVRGRGPHRRCGRGQAKPEVLKSISRTDNIDKNKKIFPIISYDYRECIYTSDCGLEEACSVILHISIGHHSRHEHLCGILRLLSVISLSVILCIESTCITACNLVYIYSD